MSIEKRYSMDETEDKPVSNHSDNTTVQDDVVRRLIEIWEDVLHTKPIAPDQNYFDLSGDSIGAVQMFTQIAEEFKIKLPLATLFEAPTIRELAEVLSRERSRSAPPAEI